MYTQLLERISPRYGAFLPQDTLVGGLSIAFDHTSMELRFAHIRG